MDKTTKEIHAANLRSPLPMLKLKKELAGHKHDRVVISLAIDLKENISDISTYIKMAEQPYTIEVDGNYITLDKIKGFGNGGA